MAINLTYALEFERPILELESKIEELRLLSSRDMAAEIKRLEKKAQHLQQKVFSRLTRWQVVQLSRHHARPCFSDYLSSLFTDFCEFAGDRCFAEDPSIICGFARFAGEAVLVLGHQKGRNTKENLQRNFGMPRPEGYRKARRLMELAARFRRPIFTFIDTPGAYPGIGAEERGQAEAIAVNLEVMTGLPVPIVSTIIGEGGSGGALAIGVGSRVLMLEYAIYSVISPEGCASILFRDAKRSDKAAHALKLTASDLLELKVIDEVISEPPGGAHRNAQAAIENVRDALHRHFAELQAMSPAQLVEARHAKFRAIGPYSEK